MAIKRQNIILSLLFGLALVSISAAAEVRFVDERPENARQIERYVSRTDGKAISADSLVDLLNRQGYLDAVVELNSLTVTINVGQRSHLARFEISGDTICSIDASGPFTQLNLEESMRSVLGPFTSDGYYYASGRVKELTRDGPAVTVGVELRQGPLVTIDKLQFTGLSRTRDKSLRRYLSLGEGDLLTDESLERAEKGAASIPFVRFHPPVEINPRQGYTSADLLLRFSEQRPFLIEGGIGYTSGIDSRFVWSLDMTFNNLFGQGRLVKLLSERREKGRTVLDLQYRQPVFWLGLDAVSAGVRTRDYRDQFYEFAAEAGYRLGLDVGFALGLDVAWRSVESSLDTPSHSSISGKFSLIRNSLDNQTNPAAGIDLALSISYSYRKYDFGKLSNPTGPSVFYETRNAVTLQFYRRLTSTLVGHLGLNYRGLETDEDLPPLSELVFVGGPTTLRGFRNDQFAAIRTAYGTVEPHLCFSNGFVFAFYDAAYLNNRVAGGPGEVKTEESYEAGYGLGFAIEKAGRLVKLSFGWNRRVSFDQPRLSVEFSSDI